MAERANDEERVLLERSFFKSLLVAIGLNGLDSSLSVWLRDLAAIAGAQRAYAALWSDPDTLRPEWLASVGFSAADVDGVEKQVSQGVIAAAVAAGRSLSTASAMLDDRFSAQRSVRRNRIEAVLCSPVMADVPVGIVYLEGRDGPGPFTSDDVDLVEAFCSRLAAVARPRAADGPDAPKQGSSGVGSVAPTETPLGCTPAAVAVWQRAGLVAPLDVPVLLSGPTGSGKSFLADKLHGMSHRQAGPLVAVNCAAIPDGLVESELFGALKGSFSGAESSIRGRVEEAAGGTLFLDEVGELSPRAQAKLLTFLQDGAYRPLGSRRDRLSDARVIAATNRDLQDRVAQGLFREDLFYRLNVFPIRLPPLSARSADIGRLARMICREACLAYGLTMLPIGADTLQVLQSMPWPGNVRQLENVVRGAAILAAGAGATCVLPHHLESATDPLTTVRGHVTYQQATRRFQRGLLERVLVEECGWNVAEAARRLGLTRSHLYNLIRVHQLQRDERRAQVDPTAGAPQ